MHRLLFRPRVYLDRRMAVLFFLGFSTLTASSDALLAFIGWPTYFAFTAIAALPGILLLVWMVLTLK